MGTKVVISNFWHNPGITVKVWQHPADAPKGAIQLEMDLDDLIKGAIQEHVHPMKVWTRTQLANSITNAVNAALEKAKQASTQGISTL